MKVLVVTNLFPNRKEPVKAMFNQQQIAALKHHAEVKVVAPLPAFRYSGKEVPAVDTVNGLEVYYPRYLVIPKILRCLHGISLFLSLRRIAGKIRRSFEFDVIYATWAYPDAFAAALTARRLVKPLAVKVHGTDINMGLQYKLRRIMIKYALNRAEHVVAVSRSLKAKLTALGIEPAKIGYMPNGVDTGLFRPMDKVECRHRLSLTTHSRHVLCIANLVPVKGVRYLIEAFLNLPGDICLDIIGDGPLRRDLEALSVSLNIKERVCFHGRKPHDEIPLWMNAADAYCLPSLNEGCPNVLLEAMACGVPVVAARVGGVTDLVTRGEQGLVVEPGDPGALTKALRDVCGWKVDRDSLAKTVEAMSWRENGHLLFENLVQAANQFHLAGGTQVPPRRWNNSGERNDRH